MRTLRFFAVISISLAGIAHADPPPASRAVTEPPSQPAASLPAVDPTATKLEQEGEHEQRVGAVTLGLGVLAGLLGVGLISADVAPFLGACVPDSGPCPTQTEAQSLGGTLGGLFVLGAVVAVPYGIYAVASGASDAGKGKRFAEATRAAPLAPVIHEREQAEIERRNRGGTAEVLGGFACLAAGPLLLITQGNKDLKLAGVLAIPVGAVLIAIGVHNESVARAVGNVSIAPTFDRQGNVGAAVAVQGVF